MTEHEETVHEGKWLRMKRRGQWEYCERTHGRDGMAVIIIAVTPQDELLFVEQYRVPLAGFVDSSSSKDFLTLLNLVTGQPYLSLTDGPLLAGSLPEWGDRSPLFICARGDQLSMQGRATYYRDVVFSYVRLAQNRPPARIEMPLWLLQEGRSQQVLDLVRAECVVGAKGYPYAAETADAVAVLQMIDRERFYALFQQFAEAEGLYLNQSRKSLSKAVRRT